MANVISSSCEMIFATVYLSGCELQNNVWGYGLPKTSNWIHDAMKANCPQTFSQDLAAFFTLWRKYLRNASSQPEAMPTYGKPATMRSFWYQSRAS